MSTMFMIVMTLITVLPCHERRCVVETVWGAYMKYTLPVIQGSNQTQERWPKSTTHRYTTWHGQVMAHPIFPVELCIMRMSHAML